MMSTEGSTAGEKGLEFLGQVAVKRMGRWLNYEDAQLHKRYVALRRRVYANLRGVLKEAMMAGKDVRRVASELTRAARTSQEAALLLCDLYEVLEHIEEYRRYHLPEAVRQTNTLLQYLERQPFSGEEVLF